ncbi:hypothetical protein ANN_16292 [Periplaneta americana]|uniref:DUF659 domain-containing protein n=1 Tax=Periplaneta americana TaxID=6978 RepID=A0ABQ8SJ08_PERAM|nr:hypothetical protein ANN_16292 [Periplaneta americana]
MQLQAIHCRLILTTRNERTEAFVVQCTDVVTAANGIKERYKNIIHITCLPHGLNKLAEEIRAMFSGVDTISAMKKVRVFLKALQRYNNFETLHQIFPFHQNQ